MGQLTLHQVVPMVQLGQQEERKVITVIVSRYGNANSKALRQRLKDHLHRREKAYLIVPEQFTLQSEINLMKDLEAEALIDIKVKSFGSLSREILERVGGISKTLISDSGKIMLLRRMVDRIADALPMYGAISNKEGFIHKIADLFSELKRAKVSPEILEELVKQPELAPQFKKKLTDVARIYREFSQGMEGKYIDSDDRLAELAERIQEADYLKDIHFYFDAFHSLSNLEEDVLQRLEEMGTDMTFALTMDPALLPENIRYKEEIKDEEVFAASRNFYRSLMEISGGRLKVVEEDLPPISPTLDLLYRNVFSYEPTSTPCVPEDIAVFQAQSTEDEVRNLAVFIRRHVMEQGYRYRDFSVIVTMPSEYNKKILRIFRDNKIPFFIDERRAFTDNSIARFVLAAVKLSASHWRSEEVFSYLKSGFTSLTEEEIQTLQNYVAKRRIRGSMYFDDKYFSLDEEFYKDKPGSLELAREETEIALRGRNKLLRETKKFYQETKTVHTVREFSVSLYEFLTRGELEERFDEYQAELEERGDTPLIQENAQVWEMILEALEQLVEILGEETLDFQKFEKMLEEGFKAMTIGILPPHQDQIVVGTMERSRSASAKFQCVLGMNDLYLPKLRKESQIFLDSEKEMLKEWDIVLPSLSNLIEADERLSIYNAFTKTTRCLVLSYALMDTGNATLRPSRILNQILDIFPNLKVTGFLNRSPEEDLYSPGNSLEFALRTLKEARERTKEVPADVKALAQGIYTYFKSRGLGKVMDLGLNYSNTKKPLDRRLARELYRGPQKISVTQIESYNTCPYQHFLTYGLRPFEDREYDVDLRELGSYMHASMEEVMKQISENPLLLENLTPEIIEEIVENHYGKHITDIVERERLESERNRFLIRKSKKTLTKAAYHVAKQVEKGSFTLLGQEVRFGLGKEIPPLRVFTGEEEIRIEGKIDRVDTYKTQGGDYIRIVDYKSGIKSLDMSRVFNGLDVQLIVYLKAVMQEEAYPAGAFYIPLADPLIEGDIWEAKEAEEVLEENLKMNGIFLKDQEILEAMDRDVLTKGTVFKTGKSVEKNNAAFDLEGFETVIQYVMDEIQATLREIERGEIALRPYRTQNRGTPCDQFCEYRNICRIDNGEGVDYREISTTVKKLEDFQKEKKQ